MLKFISTNPFNLTCHLLYISWVISSKIINMLVENFTVSVTGERNMKTTVFLTTATV
jgi:hypothetical protein